MTRNSIITVFAEEETSELSEYIKNAEALLSKDKKFVSALKLLGHSFSDFSLKLNQVSKMDPDVVYSKAKKYFEDLQSAVSESDTVTYEEGLSAAASDLLNLGVLKLLKFSSIEEDSEDETTEDMSVEEESRGGQLEEDMYLDENSENTTYSEESNEELLQRLEDTLSQKNNELEDVRGMLEATQRYFDQLKDEFDNTGVASDDFELVFNNRDGLREDVANLETEIEDIKAEIKRQKIKIKKQKRNESFRNVYNMFGTGMGRAKQVGSRIVEKGSNVKERVKEFNESEAGKVTGSVARNSIAGLIAAIISPIGVLPGLFYDFDAKKKGKKIALKNPISITNFVVCCSIVAFSALSYYMAYESLGLPGHLSTIVAYIGLIASSNLLSSGARAISKGTYSIGKSKQTFEESASTPDKKQQAVNITGSETPEQLRELYKKNKDKLTQEQKEAIFNKIFGD